MRKRQVLVALAVAAGALITLGSAAYGVMFDAYSVPSQAMTPSLRAGDRMLVQVLAQGSPRRGQVVVFRLEMNGTSQERVSRVVGVEGDTVESREGRLFVNGATVREPYLAPGTETVLRGPVTVPRGRVFLLGDNRTNSADSRVFGPVEAGSVKGRAVVRVWPPGRIGRL